jgi:hypothetical protein
MLNEGVCGMLTARLTSGTTENKKRKAESGEAR